MDHVAVKSTNIKSAGYDPEANHLEVKFHAGGHYRYENVPDSIHRGLMDAPSAGQFFASKIKGKFKTTKL